jgi:membrane associated rhomboid family serine protease
MGATVKTEQIVFGVFFLVLCALSVVGAVAAYNEGSVGGCIAGVICAVCMFGYSLDTMVGDA